MLLHHKTLLPSSQLFRQPDHSITAQTVKTVEAVRGRSTPVISAPTRTPPATRRQSGDTWRRWRGTQESSWTVSTLNETICNLKTPSVTLLNNIHFSCYSFFYAVSGLGRKLILINLTKKIYLKELHKLFKQLKISASIV